MGTRGTGPANEFSRAVNEELRALMARRGMSQSKLAVETGISQSTISKIVFANDAPLNTNQLDLIAEALDDEPSDILRRAEQALNLSAEADRQEAYDLAAKTRKARRRDASEEDYL